MHLPMHAVQLTNRPQHTGGLPGSAVYVPPSAWRVAQSTPIAGPPGRRTVSTCSAESQAQAVPTPEVLAKDNEYNQQMKQQMGWGNLNPYEYHFERGIYCHEIIPNLICGSQPRNAQDVSILKGMGVTTILNLQQDKDLHYWGVRLEEIRGACSSNGINLIRRPARDFDPHSLRKTLPSAVQALRESITRDHRVYVHCTAGLGRAPAVCIAYLYWFDSMDLDAAYKHLTDIRPCGPKRDAIRGATYDLLDANDFAHFDRLPKDAYASLSPEDRHALQYRVLKGA